MDWKQLISELTRLGVSQAEIATQTGIAPPTISELATGKTREPRWTTGQKLRALHRSAKRKAAKSNPLEHQAAQEA